LKIEESLGASNNGGFLMRNVLKAIGGIDYLRPGSSEVAQWAVMQSTADVYRDEAVATLRGYRDASRKNTWRFTALGRALTALRNVVLCVFALIIVFFRVSNLARHHR
jgi:hypothetical protein